MCRYAHGRAGAGPPLSYGGERNAVRQRGPWPEYLRAYARQPARGPIKGRMGKPKNTVNCVFFAGSAVVGVVVVVVVVAVVVVVEAHL